MSTRSRIAVLQKDGSVKSVYCHSDGYPSHVGRMLFTYHNTEEKANELVSLGWLSALYENLNPLPVAECAYYWVAGEIWKDGHSFETPQKGVTKAYSRDRKERLQIDVDATLEDFNKNYRLFQDYNYLFMDGKWHVQDGEWVELTSEIITSNRLPSQLVEEGDE